MSAVTATEVADGFHGLQTVIGLIEEAEHRAQCCIYCLPRAEEEGLVMRRGVCRPGNAIGPVGQTDRIGGGVRVPGLFGINALLWTLSSY